MLLGVLLSSCTFNITNLPPGQQELLYNPQNATSSVVILSAEPTKKKNDGGVLVATGFAIDKNRIATAAHFCVDAMKLKIFTKYKLSARQVFPNGYTKKIDNVKIKKVSDDADVCIIRAKDHMIPPLKLSKTYHSTNVGDDVTIVGAPMGIAVGVFEGKVMSLQHKGFGPEQLQGQLIVSAPATGGVSGSPIILNKTGEVIGILVMGHNTFDHLSIGVPIDELHKIR